MSTPTPSRRGKKVASAAAVKAVTAPRQPLEKAPEKDPVVRRPAKAKMTSWMDAADAAQVRGTFLATRDKTGYRSMTEMINYALMAHVHLMEHEHNKGKPFPPAYPGDVPTGRPL